MCSAKVGARVSGKPPPIFRKILRVRARRSNIGQETELFEFGGDADVEDGDARRRVEPDGGEVGDSADPGGNELIGDLLCSVGGNGDDGQAHIVLAGGAAVWQCWSWWVWGPWPLLKEYSIA